MKFEKSKRDRILKVINKLENMKFTQGLKDCIHSLIPCNTGYEFNCCIMLLKIVPFILFIISLVGPYIMLIFAFIYNFTIPIKFLSIISSICFSIAIVGIFGKGMVFCLTYPCNWFFLMLCCDLLTLLSESSILYFRIAMHISFKLDIIGFIAIIGNIIFSISFLVQHIRVYKTLNLIFTAMISMELDIIYEASHLKENVEI